MAVLPEAMDRLDGDNVSGSLAIIENYIRYMGERIEFSMQNVTRSVSAAGVSSAEVYVLITAMNNTLSALESKVEGLNGTVTGLSGAQAELGERVTGLREDLSALEGAVAPLGERLAGVESSAAALEARLTALEEHTEPGEAG